MPASTLSIGADATPGEAERVCRQLDSQLDQLWQQGFRFDVRHRAAALKLMLAWHADPAIGRLEDLLAPIFARDPDQQKRFHEIAGSWATRSVPAAPVAEAPTNQPAKAQSRSRWKMALIAVLGLFVISAIIMLRNSDTQNDAAPLLPEALAPEVEPGERRTETIMLQEHWLTSIQHQPNWSYLLPVLPMALFLAWLLWSRILPAQRWLTEAESTETDPGWLPLPRRLRRQLLAGVSEGPALLDLQLGPDQATDLLDTERTISATIDRGGALLPVYETRSFGAEYLMLIQRHDPHDHLATMFDLVVQRLDHAGVKINRFFYRDDPRFLYVPDDDKTWRLTEVLARYRHCRLVIMGTAEGYFHPLSGEPEPWLDRLSGLAPRAFLNARPLADWDWQEIELFEQGFTLALAGSNGLNRLGRHFGLGADHGAALLGVQRLEDEPTAGDRKALGDFAQPTPSAEPVRILISSTHSDRSNEKELLKALSRFNHEPLFTLFSARDLEPSDEISERIFGEIQQSRIVVFLLSPEALKFSYFLSEIRNAMDAGKTIVPIVVTPCDWRSTPLTQFHAIERSESGWEGDFITSAAWQIRAAAIHERAVVFKQVEAGWCPEMVLLPPGRFNMGATEGDNEQPVHQVQIARPFAMGRFPVTFTEFDHFCEQTGRSKPDDEGWGRDRRPVINVSRDDAQAYTAWLSETAGVEYRLPSESEWEYACRAGTTTRFAFGDELTTEMANFERKVGKTTEVGSHPPNAFGLHDMHGNVWEWVEDAFESSYRDAPADGSAHRSAADGAAVLRGGSWGGTKNGARCAHRVNSGTNSRNNFVGFRVACSSPIFSDTGH